MKENQRYRLLKMLLALLVTALVLVVGFILWREYQYGVSDAYYESLRNTGLEGSWRMI